MADMTLDEKIAHNTEMMIRWIMAEHQCSRSTAELIADAISYRILFEKGKMLYHQVKVENKDNPAATKVMEAAETLREAMQSDPEYAYTWESAIAMTLYDSTKLTVEQANDAAWLIMDDLFGVKKPS